MKNSKLWTASVLVCFFSSFLFTNNGQLMAATDIPQKIQAAGRKLETQYEKKKIKEKVHEAADYLTKDKINETVDQVADYLDTEKMKQMVDEIADYLDKEQIKQAIDLIAAYLDKDKIKEWIDVMAEHVNREKVKESLDMLVDYIDKEKVKNTLDEGIDQVANSLDQAVDFIKREISEKSSDLSSLQKNLNTYDWKHLISDTMSSDVVTLSHLKLNGHPKVVIVKPGAQIEGEVLCSLDRSHSSALSLYRVILGIKSLEGQTTVFNHFGLRTEQEKTHFSISAPKERGVYKLGFQVAKTPLKSTALKSWEEKGAEVPTIGLIVVN